MAESSLSLGLPDFEREVGYFLGFGGDSSAWTADQDSLVTRIIKRGLRQFYSPPVVNQGEAPHEWTFLKPVTTLATVSGTKAYTLPDDFGGIDGVMTFNVDQGLREVQIVSDAWIRIRNQGSEDSGYPVAAAIRPKTTTGADGQRFEMILWPKPDGVYTLTYCYLALVGALSDSYPYPYGGQRHAETVLASCLAAAEAEKDEVKGTKWQIFMERLAASIAHDRRFSAPRFLGYNSDRSDDGNSMVPRALTYTTYNGVLPS
jgi:hypothetical protein